MRRCVILSATFALVGASNAIAATLLYDFSTGGPLICTGSAPTIRCSDTDKWSGWSYDSLSGRFQLDAHTDYPAAVYPVDFDQTDGPDGQWMEIDNTMGVAPGEGALHVRVTSGPGNGGFINKKSDPLNFPSRVGSGVGGHVYIDWNPQGRHRPELKGRDRLSFWVYIPRQWNLYDSFGGPNDHNWHIGTYAAPAADEPARDASAGGPAGCSPWSWGEPCDGNSSHFYHHYTFGQWGGGGWVHLIMDKHPQWERSNNWNFRYNPTLSTFGEDYFNSLTRFYTEVTGAPGEVNVRTPYDLWMGNIETERLSQDYAESDQNTTSIASAALGYYPDGDGHWELSWSAGAIGTLGTYEVKWSRTDFTNANYASNGNFIDPLIHKAGTGRVGKLRNDPNFYRYATRFNLSGLSAGETLYFAIRDVSSQNNNGTSQLGGATDERTATDSRVYVISYRVPGGSSAGISAPRNFEVQ